MVKKRFIRYILPLIPFIVITLYISSSVSKADPLPQIRANDEGPPVFGHDDTPDKGTTGDNLTFYVAVSDDSEVETVLVEYWYGTGPSTNLTMEDHPTYSREIELLSGFTGILSYIFHSVDTMGKWSHTPIREVTVIDNDPPTVKSYLTPESVPAGSVLSFSVVPSDNIGIDMVNVEHWYVGGPHGNMTLSGNSTFHGSLLIPVNSDLDLNYVFHIWDTSLNLFTSEPFTVDVYDDTAPVLECVNASTKAKRGEVYWINISCSDNIALSEVTVEYWFDEKGPYNLTYEVGARGQFEVGIGVPDEKVKVLSYVLHLKDTGGNINSSGSKEVRVVAEEEVIDIPFIVSLSVVTIYIMISLVILLYLLFKKGQEVYEYLRVDPNFEGKVFISYTTSDKKVAHRLCDELENRGVDCWIAPRDVVPGMNYGKCIIKAIKSCALMVLVYSKKADVSPQVQREVERAVSRNVAIIPVRVEEVVPSEEMEYFISSTHWLDLYGSSLENCVDELINTIGAKEKGAKVEK